FDAFSGKVVDVLDSGIIESYKMKEQVLKTAFEVTTMLLRIDEVVDRRYAKRHEGELGGQ
ncbi:MAG: TCP-1/cpn60 chaperonin family protein, partial [Nitrososphaerota archaeon]